MPVIPPVAHCRRMKGGPAASGGLAVSCAVACGPKLPSRAAGGDLTGPQVWQGPAVAAVAPPPLFAAGGHGLER